MTIDAAGTLRVAESIDVPEADVHRIDADGKGNRGRCELLRLFVRGNDAFRPPSHAPGVLLRCSMDDARASIQEAIEQRLPSDGPGSALHVMRGGETLWRGGRGMANLEWDIPIAAETIFRAHPLHVRTLRG